MPHYNFEKDLNLSIKSEKELSILLEKYGISTIKFNSDNRYDIEVRKNNKKYSIEVKEDFLCKNTGNVAVEFECRGKKSGISVTEALFHVYKIHEPSGKIGFYIMRTDTLKMLILNGKYHRIVNGGDSGSNSMNYLFYLSDIKENSLFLGNIE